MRPGRQDLTADVNFVDLQEWGEQLGLKPIQSVTQADFIREWNRERSKSQKTADRYISDESGMGKAFKVLHQRKPS